MTTSLSMKKIALGVAGLAIVFSAAFATTARAATAEELQAQIQSLLAMIANLQAQLAGSDSTGGTTGGTCTAMQFTLNHKIGDKGGEVMNIQKFLNMDPATMVAASGAGSPGNETSYFGPATKAAVIKFQNKYASEILAPVGLSAGTGYWGSSTRAKANALEIARCASTDTGTGTGTPTPAADLTVSAAAQPGNSLAPANATNLPFTKFTLTAGTSDVTVTGVKVKLGGLADKSNISTVVLLDESGMQIGRTRVLQSDYTATIGDRFTVPAGTSKTFTVAANIASTVRPGEVAMFEVVSVETAAATVSGTLPIAGAQHTMNSSLSIATITVSNGANFPAITTKEIGSTNVIFGSARLTNNSSTEDVVLKAVRFYQAGSAATSDLDNLKVMVDGVEYPVVVSTDGKYFAVSFGNGITIAKGLSKDVDIKGDVVSGVNRTIQFQIYEASDINAMGAMYGYGSPITGTFPKNLSTSAITIDGATLNSLSRSNDAPAANITVAKPNEVLGAFEIDLKGEGVDVTSMDVLVDVKEAGNTTTDETGIITNVTLVDGNGRVLAGPVDFTDTATGTDAANTLDGTNDGKFAFSGVTFPVGKTVVYVKGQLSSSMLQDGDAVQVSTDASTWTGVRGVSSGTTVTITGSATANPMTVRTAKGNLVTAANPNSSIIAGATNIVLAEGELDATASGDDLRVTNITVKANGQSATENGYLKNVKVYADTDNDGTYETMIGSAQSFAGSADPETLVYALSPSLEVPKGGKVGIQVIGDVQSGVTSTGMVVTLSAASAVGKTTGVTATITAVGSGVSRSIAANGSLVLSDGANNPSASLILDATASGNASQTIAEFKLTAGNEEDVEVRTINFGNAGTGSNRAVLALELYDGSTLIASQTNTLGTNVAFDLTANPIVVPAGGYKNITVKVKTNDIAGSVANGDTAQVTLTTANMTSVGVESQATITETGSFTDVADKMYEAYPTVAVTASGSSKTLNPSTEMEVMEITLTNMGDKDITFDTGNSDQIKVSILGDILATASAKIKDADGNALCTANMVSNVLTCDFATKSLTVPANGSKVVKVFADTSALTTANDTVYARLLDATGTFVYDINAATDNFDVSTYVLNGNVDGPTYVKP